MIPGINEYGEISGIYVNTIMQSVFAIALPAYLIVAWTNHKPVYYLKIINDGKLPSKMIFALLVFMVSYFFASFLAQLNKGMILPESMKNIEEMMRSMEDAALETTDMLLSGKSLGSLIMNLVVVAGFAAISEELFFRGALQQFIYEKLKNDHVSIWLTALVFSLVHFQFYGFLPRLFLGAILGYLFNYTQNLWAPILFHFLNNATVIILNFFWSDREWYKNLEETSVTPVFTGIAIVSLVLTIALFWVYNNQTSKNIYNDTNSTDNNI
ncbi:MAG: CPBP family intramembrane metalloprotease [Fermentimonas sp.]|nr:CPBP family intramembrane metalloprotease [Fermentimonas sp.]MDD2930701.1 CPBP family intramembrane metalloprotease [Fermentimonas sp.]MDD3510441.1 CPBP family intramembrane metalloprotease [Fermentimonas sp.]MDD4284552.1 CPBP family intramembrane metalloprotease [Fermentimonas sp.]MDD4724429.1 CPBP family intramembrane metalloprotease [Fermentimonas sp.]